MNLVNLNLVELNAQELRETEGGGFGPFNFGLGFSLRTNFTANWEAILREQNGGSVWT